VESCFKGIVRFIGLLSFAIRQIIVGTTVMSIAIIRVLLAFGIDI